MLRGCWCLFWVSSLVGCATPRDERVSGGAFDWVRSVLLGAEVGDSRESVVRWRTPVRYLIVAPPIRMRTAVDRAYVQLRAALRGLHELHIEYVAADDVRIGQDGFVTVFATAPREALLLARRYGAQPPVEDADGWFSIIWNHRFELTRAIVFVDPSLPPHWLVHTALEEMFQVLGPSNDSALVRDSILFEGPVEPGSHQQLGHIDRQVLRLLYRELRAGDSVADIRRAMRRSWALAPGTSTLPATARTTAG